MLINDDMAFQITEQLKILKEENAELKEKLQNYIPRRRVRRVFKQLKNIMEQDIKNENQQYVNILKKFCKNIELHGQQEAGEDIRQAIEHILGSYSMEFIKFGDKGVTVESPYTYTIITDHSIEVYDYEGNEIMYLVNDIQLKKED